MDYNCSVCKEAISSRVHNYSMDRFGKPLCVEHQKAVNDEKYFCSECKQEISYGQYKFSLREFGMVLCRDCQPEVEEKFSAPPQKHELNKTSPIEFGKSPTRSI